MSAFVMQHPKSSVFIVVVLLFFIAILYQLSAEHRQRMRQLRYERRNVEDNFHLKMAQVHIEEMRLENEHLRLEFAREHPLIDLDVLRQPFPFHL